MNTSPQTNRSNSRPNKRNSKRKSDYKFTENKLIAPIPIRGDSYETYIGKKDGIITNLFAIQ